MLELIGQIVIISGLVAFAGVGIGLRIKQYVSERNI